MKAELTYFVIGLIGLFGLFVAAADPHNEVIILLPFLCLPISLIGLQVEHLNKKEQGKR